MPSQVIWQHQCIACGSRCYSDILGFLSTSHFPFFFPLFFYGADSLGQLLCGCSCSNTSDAAAQIALGQQGAVTEQLTAGDGYGAGVTARRQRGSQRAVSGSQPCPYLGGWCICLITDSLLFYRMTHTGSGECFLKHALSGAKLSVPFPGGAPDFSSACIPFIIL